MDVIPAIDLLGTTVVRLSQGDYQSKKEYSYTPEKVAQEFINAGAKCIHVVDLDGARSGKPTNSAQILIIRGVTKAANVKVQLGGGARDRKTIKYMLAELADRVVVGSAAIKDWDWFQGLLQDDDYPNDRLALGLDARNGYLAIEGWTKQLDKLAMDFAALVRGSGLGAIVYTDIGRDGMLTGVNFGATAELIAATDVPVIASGGIASLGDIKRCKEIGCAGVIVGRAYYEGKIDLAKALEISA